MSEDFDRFIADSSSCDLDEIDYPYISVNPSVDLVSDDPQDLDPDFKASSLLMALNSGDDIQATPETCLLINKTLQEVVSDLLRIIAKEVQGIEVAKLHVVQPSISLNSNIDSSLVEKGLPAVTTDNLAYSSNSRPERPLQNPIRCPFFQSRDFSKPPLNHEATLRRERGEFNPPDFMPLCWRKPDNRRLSRAVASDCRQRQLMSLTRELHKKEEEYNEWLIAGPKSKALKKEIDKLNFRIAKVQACSDETFIDLAMTPEEIDQIDWMKISASDFHGVISDRNLRLVWINQFNKVNNYGPWSKKEDETLKNAIARFGLHAWNKVADAIGTKRTPFMCIQRYQQRLAPRQTPAAVLNVDLDGEASGGAPWMPSEDTRLRELVRMATDEQGVIHWIFVYTQMNRRSLEDCRRRWVEISPEIQRGPFTEREDLQLLFGVQRYGSENFDLIAAKCLAHRDPRDCRKRYLQLTTDLASEWTYDEDRKLFVLMEKVEETFRRRIKATPNQNVSIPFRCYKDLLIHLPGRTWQTIRNRHRLLMSWNVSYLSLRRMVCRPRNGDESNEEDINAEIIQTAQRRRWTRAEVRAVFLRTPFMLNLLEKLQSAGARSAEFIRDIFSTEVPTKTEALDSGRPLTINLELDPMLRDAAEGIIVPRPLRRDRWLHILRHTELRMLLETRVRDALESQLREELRRKGVPDVSAAMTDPTMCSTRRCQVLRTLLEDEDHFLLAMEQSLRFPNIAQRFQSSRSVGTHLSLVPDIVKRCVNDTHQLLVRHDRYPLESRTTDLKAELKNATGENEQRPQQKEADEEATEPHSEPGPSTPMDAEDSVRQEIDKRLKVGVDWRYGRGQNITLLNKLKRCFEIFDYKRRMGRVRQLMRWKKSPMDSLVLTTNGTEARLNYEENRRKVYQLLSEALRYNVNSSERTRLREVQQRGRVKLLNLPPNNCTLNAFRLLLLQRPQLFTRGQFHIEALFRMRLHMASSQQRPTMTAEMRKFVDQSMHESQRKKARRLFERQMTSHLMRPHQKILKDPRYLLLRARLFALFLWPAMLSSGKVEDYFEKLKSSIAMARKEYHPDGRERKCLVRKKRVRTNTFFEALRERIAQRHAAVGIDTSSLRKARRRQAAKGTRRSYGEREASWRLRSEANMEHDLVRVDVSERKCLVMPFAALELLHNGYQLDSYYPIESEENFAVSVETPPLPGPSRVVKQELLED